MRRPMNPNNITQRRLFNLGGTSPTMGAQAQMPNPSNIQMGGTLPSANIMAPSGILSSSTELSNAVGDQALAQSFAPTANMNSGGIASFEEGGFGSRFGDFLSGTVSAGANFLGIGNDGTSMNPERERYEENRLNPYLDNPGFTGPMQAGSTDLDTVKEDKNFNKEYEESLPVVESTIDQTTYGGNIGINSSSLDTRTLSTDLDTVTGPMQAGSWLDENSTMTSERMFPAEQRSFYLGSRNISPKSWEMLDNMWETDVPRSRIKAAFMKTMTPILGTALSIRGGSSRILENVFDTMTTVPESNDKKPNWGHTLAVTDMVRQQPNYSQDITEYATNIINNNPDISSQDLIEQVAIALKTKQEMSGNPIIGDLTIAADAERDAENSALEAGRTTLAEDIESGKASSDEIEDIINMKIDQSDPFNQTSAMPPQSLIEEAYKRWANTGFSNDFITDVLIDENRPPEFINAVVNMRGEESEEGAGVPPTEQDGSPNLGTEVFRKDITSYAVGSEGKTLTKEKEKEKVINAQSGGDPDLNIPGSSKEDLKIINENLRKIDANNKEGGQSSKEVETNLGEALADQVIKGDGTETTNDTFKKYFEMFKNSMGEFEGKSEYAKGMDLVALGAAIAGGESPNAMTNIANGITKTIDRFTEDDDARKQYNNQVRLSGGKFALTEMMSLAKEQRARDYTMLPYIRINKDGTIDEKQFSLTDISNGKVPTDFKSATVGIAEMQNMSAIDAAFQKGKAAFKYKPTDWSAVKKEAGEYNKQFGENSKGKFLAQEALKLVNDKDLRGKIFGVSGVAEEVKNRLVRLFGGGQDVYTSRDQLLKELQQYFQALIPVKLRSSQSANSISNKDVQWLADAFMIKGAQEGKLLTFAFASAPAISAKLQSAYVDFADGEIDAMGNMNTLYEENMGMQRPNTSKASDYFEQKYYKPGIDKEGNPILDEEGNPIQVFKGYDYSPGAQKSLIKGVWDMDYLKETGIYRRKN